MFVWVVVWVWKCLCDVRHKLKNMGGGVFVRCEAELHKHGGKGVCEM